MQIREEVITKKKFVTSDGHEFEFQSDALAHEAELLIKGKVARLTFNGKSYRVFTPQNEEEYTAFVRYLMRAEDQEFTCYLRKTVIVGQPIVAALEEYRNDRDNVLCFRPLSSFIKEKQEEIDDLQKELSAFSSLLK